MIALVKTIAVTSAVGAAGLAQVDPVKMGEHIGGLQPAPILGIISVICVIGLVATTRAKDKLTEKLYKLIEESTKASEKHAANAQHMAGVLVELKDSVKDCRRR